MIYLVNALSLNMVPPVGGTIVYRPIDRVDAAKLAVKAKHAIGHAETAALVGKDLFGLPLAASRSTVQTDIGDKLIVAQYRGPRLPEGATTLPEGAKIEYFLVEILNF